jgi:hypothetical protein
MVDATVGALASVPAPARPEVATATSVNLIFTATKRDRIAYVAFVASVNPTGHSKLQRRTRTRGEPPVALATRDGPFSDAFEQKGRLAAASPKCCSAPTITR